MKIFNLILEREIIWFFVFLWRLLKVGDLYSSIFFFELGGSNGFECLGEENFESVDLKECFNGGVFFVGWFFFLSVVGRFFYCGIIDFERVFRGCVGMVCCFR